MTTQQGDGDVVAIDITSRMGVLSDDRCAELLATTPIGRIGFVSEGQPIVLPVTYAWHDGDVVFRTLEGQKLAAAAYAQPVCFEIDEWDAHDREGWSVVVKGVADEVTEWAEIEQLEQIGLAAWSHETWRRIWVRVTPTEITGRVLR